MRKGIMILYLVKQPFNRMGEGCFCVDSNIIYLQEMFSHCTINEMDINRA